MLLRVGSGGVRLLLLRSSTGRSRGRAGRSAARRGGSGTTLLTRHFGCACEVTEYASGRGWLRMRRESRYSEESGDWKKPEAESVGEQANSEPNSHTPDWWIMLSHWARHVYCYWAICYSHLHGTSSCDDN